MQSDKKLNLPISSTKISNDLRDLLHQYMKNAIDAYKNHRIFSMFSTKTQATKELKSRGWYEKLCPSSHTAAQELSIHTLLRNAKPGNDYELVLMSKLLNNFPTHFVWVPRRLYAEVSYDRTAVRNRIQRAKHLDYSTKVGLVGCAEQQYWHKKEGICEMNHPRFYRMGGIQEERKEFIDDFHRTQCRSFVKYIVERCDYPILITDKDFGTVLPKVLKFALKILRLELDDFEHNSLDDSSITDDSSISSESWSKFMYDSSQIINMRAKLKADISDILKYKKIGSRLLKRLGKKQPDYQWDGCRNIWILKPAYKSGGIGIVVKNSLEDILQYTKKLDTMQYIAQKYVERPLLIYNTKFDIRQHVLLTMSDTMMRIYMYQDCYCKMASQEFTLENFSTRIHLTNHAVQKSYKDCLQNPMLPKSLMMSLNEFKVYLLHHDVSPNIWENKIFPGFCRNVVAVLSSGLEETDFVKNTFDVIGCDFMLDEHYNPIMIELNCNPDLSSSTEVMKGICPMLQRDVIKVLLDLPKNADADIGKFKLIYELKHNIEINFQPNLNMSISGKSLHSVS